ncbi:Granulin repeat cysteine protease family protein [Trifolium repens]|nr:Granulin repeat cysteine protease family protein [Trifolium repens]
MFTIFTVTFALDMSIISYDTVHTDKSSWRSDDEVKSMYKEWRVKYGKLNNNLDESKNDKRFEIFKDNLKFIDEHNAENRTYKVGLNRFADLSNEEYRGMYLGIKIDEMMMGRTKTRISNRYAPTVADNLPKSIDWRNKGAVVQVKHQQKCGSCWAFSAVAAVEGINKIVTGELVSLSEQELVDCDLLTINAGCDGGNMEYAFEFIINNGGIDTDDDYPYLGLEDICDESKKNARVVTIDDYELVPAKDELALKKAVANQPISVSVEAGGIEFQLYESGIFTALSCGLEIDHGVTAVGYGTENGVDYWIVKNSWGKD